MPSFRFDALDSAGTRHRGSLDAVTREDARQTLARRALFILEVAPASAKPIGRSRVSAEDLALGFRSLASLLESGVPLSRALDAFEHLAPPSWSAALPVMQTAVREGKGLAEAIASAPLPVPPVVLGLLRAGEGGAGLSASVGRAAQLTESTLATRRAVASALSYPIVLALAGSVSLALLVVVVMPRFAAILEDVGRPLPGPTALVLSLGEAVRSHWAVLFLVAIAVVVTARMWSVTAGGRRRLHGVLLQLPIFGGIRWSIATGRACSAASSLLEAGVPLMQVLPLAAAASGDAVVEERLTTATEHVRRGEQFGSALQDTRAFTTTAVQLVQAGEASGRLSEMLAHAATVETARAEDLLRRAIRILEPALIVGFGLIVAFVAAAMLQAVYAIRPG